jgi:hypothetical protein
MGLDQFAMSVKADADITEDDLVSEELAYWRKHNRLQGYMERLWRENPENTDTFNCERLELTLEDLDDLEQVINDRSLPETQGFFFGGDSYEDYEDECGYKKTDLEFIEKARNALNKGERVIYSSWY